MSRGLLPPMDAELKRLTSCSPVQLKAVARFSSMDALCTARDIARELGREQRCALLQREINRRGR